MSNDDEVSETPALRTRALLIGATGPMGRAVLGLASGDWLQIRSFARRPETLEGVSDDVVQGDVRDLESVQSALVGMDAVICVLGGKPWHRDAKGVHEVGTRNLLAAMRAQECKRLVAVTGIGAGSSKGHGPFYYDWIARPTVLRKVYADKETQEHQIMDSDFNWTIVRPAILVKNSPRRPLQAKQQLGAREKMGPISREDVARFLLEELRAPAHIGEIVHLYT